MSAPVKSAPFLVGASPRKILRHSVVVWLSSRSAHLPVAAFRGCPVGLTLRKGLRQAASIGPWRPCSFRRPVGLGSAGLHAPLIFTYCSEKDWSAVTGAADTLLPSIVTTGVTPAANGDRPAANRIVRPAVLVVFSVIAL